MCPVKTHPHQTQNPENHAPDREPCRLVVSDQYEPEKCVVALLENFQNPLGWTRNIGTLINRIGVGGYIRL